MKETLLSLFKKYSDDFVSFQEICDILDVSAEEAMLVIGDLKDEGYIFEADADRGYRLLSHPDTLTQWEIASRLDTRYFGRFLDTYFRSTTSTNDILKEKADRGAPEGTSVVADVQEGGKGRRGREWATPPPGLNIAMSILLRPHIETSRLPSVTLVAAMAVRQAIADMIGEASRQATVGVVDEAPRQQVLIKWPNDIVFNGGKLAGILTELFMEDRKISYAVVGIGINVNNEVFQKDLCGKATSLYLETGKKWQRAELIARIFSNFEDLYERFLSEGFGKLSRDYEKYLAGMGKNAMVMDREPWTGTVMGVNDDGALLAADDSGIVHEISSGEISIRGINGYSP